MKKKLYLSIVTRIISYGFEGDVFLVSDFYGELTKERIREIQKEWDGIYGGFMRYEMVILK